jgi:tetratricopeptide (TPR) repeat protein
MKAIEKTVFISYRRTNWAHARLVYDHLTRRGFDVCLDTESVRSGDWEQIIISEIARRDHFLLVLTRSSLKRCKNNPNDPYRKEIEQALKTRRNIIPLVFEGFDFNEINEYLPEKLHRLKKYNASIISGKNFDAEMARVRNWLNVSLDDVPHPRVPEASENERAAITQMQIKLESMPVPTEQQLDSEILLELGTIAYWDEDYDTAIRLINQVIKIDPRNAEAFRIRGKYYNYKEKYNKAIIAFDKSLNIDSGYGDAYIGRGTAYARLNKYDRAIEDFIKHLHFCPDCSAAYANLGDVYRKKEDLDQAIQFYNKSIGIDSDDARVYHNRGIAYHNNGDYDLAIQDYNNAIRLNPADAETYLNRGNAHEAQRDFDLAIADYNTVLKLDRRDSSALNNLGLIYSYQGDYKVALSYFRKAVKIDGGSIATLYNIAVMSVKIWGLTKSAKAIKKANSIIQKAAKSKDDGERGAALYAWAGLTAMQGGHDDALDRLEKAIPLEPDAKQWARKEVAWEDLRDNPRFKALVGE